MLRWAEIVGEGGLIKMKYPILLYGKPSSRQIPVLGLVLSRSNPCIFVLEQSPQIQNLQPRQQKKGVKIVILHIGTTSRS